MGGRCGSLCANKSHAALRRCAGLLYRVWQVWDLVCNKNSMQRWSAVKSLLYRVWQVWALVTNKNFMQRWSAVKACAVSLVAGVGSCAQWTLHAALERCEALLYRGWQE